jgi:hypothetical protein
MTRTEIEELGCTAEVCRGALRGFVVEVAPSVISIRWDGHRSPVTYRKEAAALKGITVTKTAPSMNCQSQGCLMRIDMTQIDVERLVVLALKAQTNFETKLASTERLLMLLKTTIGNWTVYGFHVRP